MESCTAPSVTVDLLDMLFYFLKKWKSLVVLVVIFGVLAGGFAAMNPPAYEVPTLAVATPSETILNRMEQATILNDYFEANLRKLNDAEDFVSTLELLGTCKELIDYLEEQFDGDLWGYYLVNFRGQEMPTVLDPAMQSMSSHINKFVVVGIFLGIVVWGIWCMFAYCFSAPIKTAQQLSQYCGAPLLGRIRASQQGKGIDRLLYLLSEKSQCSPSSVLHIATVINGAVEGTAVLCGDQSSQAVVKLMQEVERECSKVCACGLIAEDTDSLKAAQTAGSAIMVVHVRKTPRVQILREMETCRTQRITVVGVIAVES